MEDLVHDYWWLIFPIMWFVFGMFGMWMASRRHRDTIELMKTYAAQGKDPAEIAKVMNGGVPPGWGGYMGPWGGPWGWRAWRWGPMWEWRRTIIFGCLAIGFFLAYRYAEFPGDKAFMIVAIIMGVLAAGSLIMAIVSTAIGSRPRNE